MAKILCPNKQYTGISASVPFVNGVGETDKPHLIAWFKSHGYTVEGEAQADASKPIEKMTKAELKAFAAENGISIEGCEKNEQILDAIRKHLAGNPDFSAMTVEELTSYAEEHAIDIAGLTEQSEILKKIQEAVEEKTE